MGTRRGDPTRLPAVSLFTGAGGLDIGLEKAGFDVVTAADFDADCVETLRLNQRHGVPIPEAPEQHFLHRARLLHARVEDLTGDDLRPRSSPRHWAPVLLAGGPPCQPFSSAGKGLAMRDPRGKLFQEFVRLAGELKPQFILFENVRGLVTARGPSGEPGEVLSLVKRSFEELGYATTFALLNAADYGAPQRRVRLFMLAARVSPLPSFPEPTHAAEAACLPLLRRKAWVSLGEFLKSARIENDPGDIVRPSASLGPLLEKVPAGSGLRSPGAREATRPGGHWGYKQGTFVADPTKPARTVTAASTQDWIRELDGRLRRLTLRECAALQGFPGEWAFHGDRVSKFRQIGNAVPTVFGQVLGSAVARSRSVEHASTSLRSAPLPPYMLGAIKYTQREEQRNGESRRLVRERLKDSDSTLDLKGFGRLGECPVAYDGKSAV